ncbi:DUF2442 domain-containing protein [Paraglaciecola arctica]|uniref:DUF2442 domain-containing protein n=1 Tax=Paraglaciecola arctica TaxID=1128911 RepID=UPI001C069FC4|nr:DUF2442 domain-containing protein [Paraglaciecola arctica]
MIKCTDSDLIVELIDDRIISTPLVCFPLLSKGTLEQLANWELLGDGDGIH